MQNNSSNTDQLNKRVVLYTAIAGTLCSGAALANPTLSVQNSGLSFTVSDQNTNGYAYFDIDGDGVDDFYLGTWWSGSDCDYSPGASMLQGIVHQNNQMLTDDDDYGGMISAGSSVPGTLDPVQYQLNFAFCDIATDFAPDTSGYAGFQFDINGNTHYGYVRIGTTQSDDHLTTTFHEVCYESTPGAPIEAGDCGVTRGVPVGGLIPISLGVLALGASALRRRRKHLS